MIKESVLNNLLVRIRAHVMAMFYFHEYKPHTMSQSFIPNSSQLCKRLKTILIE